MLRDVERSSNPWGKPQTERAGMGGGARRARARAGRPRAGGPLLGRLRGLVRRAGARVAESTAKLLQAAGVDFAILGPREACTGDPARRMGNEYVFQAFAEQNVATLNEAGRDEDRRELPALLQHARERVRGLRRPLRGHAPLASCSRELVQRAGCAGGGPGRSRTTTAATSRATTTCVVEPRKLLNVIGQPVEMARSGKKTFCCGAGGAHMWMEERGSGDQRGARARGGGDGRGHARGRVPVLHGDARRRRARSRARRCASRTSRRCSPSRSRAEPADYLTGFLTVPALAPFLTKTCICEGGGSGGLVGRCAGLGG